MPATEETRFAAIDFESTGSAPAASDSPVQVGLACWSVRESLHDLFVSDLFTDTPVEESAFRVHGIGPERVAAAPTLLSLWPDVRQRLAGAFVVAHGKGTEKRFLRAFPGHGFGPWVDTLLLARAAWPSLGDHSLGSLCDRFGLSEAVRRAVPGRSWHDALFDAVASLVLLEKLITDLSVAALPADFLTRPDLSAWHRARRK